MGTLISSTCHSSTCAVLWLAHPAVVVAGVARTIATRLLGGLTGCALVCASFPFLPESSTYALCLSGWGREGGGDFVVTATGYQPRRVWCWLHSAHRHDGCPNIWACSCSPYQTHEQLLGTIASLSKWILSRANHQLRGHACACCATGSQPPNPLGLSTLFRAPTDAGLPCWLSASFESP